MVRDKDIRSSRKKTDDLQLPNGKWPYPTQPGQAPFAALERLLDIEAGSDAREVVREIRAQATRKLELLEVMYRDLINRAQVIVEKAKEDLHLHSVRMYSTKIRNRVYYLYRYSDGLDDAFFSILEPEEYLPADPDARFDGTYHLNDDGSWTRIDIA
ncbi:DUF2452 domain-containing protein [bacterium]|nr:DUF2452 domain-containing protein [candidate division CSSED10-310 bacterium]